MNTDTIGLTILICITAITITYVLTKEDKQPVKAPEWDSYKDGWRTLAELMNTYNTRFKVIAKGTQDADPELFSCITTLVDEDDEYHTCYDEGLHNTFEVGDIIPKFGVPAVQEHERTPFSNDES